MTFTKDRGGVTHGFRQMVEVVKSFIFLIGVLFVSVLAWQVLFATVLSVSQPRDGFRKFALEYAQVFEDIQTYCALDCSQEEIQPFLRRRDQVLKEGEWSRVVDKLAQRWRWRRHSFYGLLTYDIRDDFFRLMSEVGGKEALKECRPMVRWWRAGTNFYQGFDGVLCGNQEYLLRY